MKKSSQLVSQHLENVSRKVLEDYQDVIRDYARQRQGVYALYRNGRLYYVGLATNLRNRMSQHLNDKHKESWDSFSLYFTIGDHHLKELEALILRIVEPKGNKQKGAFARSEDIRRRFRRDVKLRALKGVSDLFPDKDRAPQEPKSADKEERKPILAKYKLFNRNLRADYKEMVLMAKVRQDGSIRYRGKTFNSPSVAAAVACKRRSCNGWTLWKYERAPGDWVLLDTLRK